MVSLLITGLQNFWSFMYWVMPGHYSTFFESLDAQDLNFQMLTLSDYSVSVFEGLFLSQFDGDETLITASPNSPFFQHLGCTPETVSCQGTVEEWMATSFPDFSRDNIKWNALYLVVLIISTRVITFTALSTLDYKSN